MNRSTAASGEDILAGRLAAGEKLPSKRLLAKHLSVSVITVENAYAQLAAEGYIYSLPKRGFFVEKLVPEDFPQPHPAPRSTPAASTPKPVERNGWFADLVTNHIPAENFPFSTWAKLMRNVLSLEEDELMRSPSAQGRRELQEAIAEHLYHFRGMSVEPDQIVIGAGTEYLYGLLVQFLGRDKLYGVEEPGYQKPGQIYRKLRRPQRGHPHGRCRRTGRRAGVRGRGRAPHLSFPPLPHRHRHAGQPPL